MLKLSEKFESIWNRMLRDVANAAPYSDGPVRMTWPRSGWLYAGDLMVMGISGSGARPGLLAETLSDEKVRREAISQARSRAEGDADHCPMDWLTRSRPEEHPDLDLDDLSRFWQVIRGVLPAVAKAGFDPAQWSSYLHYTNVYPVRPAHGTDNPGSALRKAQRVTGPMLLYREIEEANPRRVLFLASLRRFRQFFPNIDVEERSHPLEGIATCDGRRWVITPHPSRRSPAEMIKAVTAAFLEVP